MSMEFKEKVEAICQKIQKHIKYQPINILSGGENFKEYDERSKREFLTILSQHIDLNRESMVQTFSEEIVRNIEEIKVEPILYKSRESQNA